VSPPETDASLAEGIRLFNRGDFFAAHEVWEQAWKRAAGDEKIFYQGMIQAAAAFLHVRRGNDAGAVSTYLKCRGKLEHFPAVWKGIDLVRLRSELACYFDALQRWPDARRDNSLPTVRAIR